MLSTWHKQFQTTPMFSLHGMSLTSSTSVRRKSNSKSRFGVHRNYCWKSKRQLNYVPTTNESKRSCLDSYRFLERPSVAKDEKVLGFDNLQSDPYGGFVSNPIISDVQDEPLAERLESQGLPKRDAQHLAQAISNNADVLNCLCQV